MSDALHRRANLVDRAAERWRPPLFKAPTTAFARVIASLRRFLDLQAGSIWRDLKAELAKPHGSVLDVGCGAQPYRPLVNANDKYVGIDIAAAKDYFGYEVPDTLYYDGDNWPVEDASAGLVLCTETLEHVRDPSSFLTQAARVTKPGGVLLLTVPFAARWHFIPHDYWRYTPSSLRDLLEKHGFIDVAVFARGNHITVACYKVMALILPLLMPAGAGWIAGILLRLVGLLFSPLLLVLAIIANLSIVLSAGGDDCLGYTATAARNGS
jgi:SAM-dependent methyltransferase